MPTETQDLLTEYNGRLIIETKENLSFRNHLNRIYYLNDCEVTDSVFYDGNLLSDYVNKLCWQKTKLNWRKSATMFCLNLLANCYFAFWNRYNTKNWLLYNAQDFQKLELLFIYICLLAWSIREGAASAPILALWLLSNEYNTCFLAEYQACLG